MKMTRVIRFLTIGPEVSRALNWSKSVVQSRLVLLESAILTHGMPYPENFQMAMEVEEIIKQQGAIPATVGVLGGQVKVGLTKEEIEHLSKPSAQCKIKVSRRDYPKAISAKLDGGTTVSGTLAAASLVADKALPIFVTGGIGGVHRDGENTLDISADLVEMGRSSTTVISAGIKSILDIGRTLEYLETQGVCVATLGPDKEFPSFFSRQSGFVAPHNVSDTKEAAHLIANHNQFGLNSGILLGVPIPEEASAEGKEIEDAIQRALRKARESGINGRDVTPFVLSEVNKLTRGLSLQANLALIKNNAKVGAEIAVELSKFGREKHYDTPAMKQRIDVIGGSNVDITTSIQRVDSNNKNGSTENGKIRVTFGGVGRNIADALSRLELSPNFISAVGNDDLGKCLLGHNKTLPTGNVSIIENIPTATYSLFVEQGDLKIGVGDMSIHSEISPDLVKTKLGQDIKNPLLMVLDGNLSKETLHICLQHASESGIPVFFEPADVRKVQKVVDSEYFPAITYSSPNVHELQSLSGQTFETEVAVEELLKSCVHCCESLLNVINVLIVTLGKNGVLIARNGSPEEPLPLTNALPRPTKSYKHYPVPTIVDPISVSGAGDCFVAAFIKSVIDGRNQDEAVSSGMQAARISLQAFEAVPVTLNCESINWHSKAQGNLIVQ